ncbi:hypothetical protein ABES03_11380 [Neobacillus rhizosphaerae]|uniref:hypothetical protein n=1 Tax=Neobacillus rhizosphaerae TaxID=2880965 RepID=UPI003D27394F
METILFLIIVGVISTIFGKTKGTQGKAGNKPFSVGNMKDIRTLFDEFTKEKPRETFSVETNTHMEVPKNLLKNLENEYVQVRQESEASRTRMAATRQQAERVIEPATKIKHQEITKPVALENPDVNTFVNGIIWSEILGEPRAKRPYLSKRR